MREVLISIQPKWCELIASSKKTVEVRKTRPKIDTPFKCYIYQTKMKWVFNLLRKMGLSDLANRLLIGKGKVIGEFICDRITPIAMPFYECVDAADCETTCLSPKEILDYADHKPLYGWHISDLVIYDKPKGLDDFRKIKDCHRGKIRENCIGCWDCEITRPPQSWCYVESQ